jgi:hypothetical protein
MIRLAWRSNSALCVPSLIVQVESLLIFKGIANVEWAVLPRGKRREAMPLEAALRTISPFDRMAADNVFQTNVFPVPPYPYRKKTHLIQTEQL